MLEVFGSSDGAVQQNIAGWKYMFEAGGCSTIGDGLRLQVYDGVAAVAALGISSPAMTTAQAASIRRCACMGSLPFPTERRQRLRRMQENRDR
ncbi:hypothetical protein GCM10028772_07500 [Nocardioides ultimimeridianus]